MVSSTCIRCGHQAFEMAESSIGGLRFKRDFLQCAQCGGVVGVIEADNLNARLDAIEQKLLTVSSAPRTTRRKPYKSASSVGSDIRES